MKKIFLGLVILFLYVSLSAKNKFLKPDNFTKAAIGKFAACLPGPTGATGVQGPRGATGNTGPSFPVTNYLSLTTNSNSSQHPQTIESTFTPIIFDTIQLIEGNWTIASNPPITSFTSPVTSPKNSVNLYLVSYGIALENVISTGGTVTLRLLAGANPLPSSDIIMRLEPNSTQFITHTFLAIIPNNTILKLQAATDLTGLLIPKTPNDSDTNAQNVTISFNLIG
jgi:hypothetical protein